MSDLLNQASLVMVPSGYKEDTVYSVVPTDGSGDLSFTRASNGTRINSAGLVEVCSWNMLEYSEQFDNGVWAKELGNSITANTETAPNGVISADTLTATAGNNMNTYQLYTTLEGVYTYSVYLKKKSTNIINPYIYQTGVGFKALGEINFDNGTFTTSGGTASIENVGNGWYRVSLTASLVAVAHTFGFFTTSTTGTRDVYIWGAQVNIGSTAKPYFPTTDRLNVPRLTYQNGGGGCPSLLLEKQSTNTALYSEDFSNAFWVKEYVTISTNATTSPDGTQNADKIQEDTTNASHVVGNNDVFAGGGQAVTFSIFLKASERSWAALRLYNGSSSKFAWYNLANGVLGTVDSGVTASIENYGNGWYRCIMTITMSSVSITLPYVFISTGNNVKDYTGTSGSGLFVWGAQHEASSYPTSYIPTTSSSATRVADVATVNLPNTNMTFTAYLELDEASLGTAAGDWFSIFSNVSALGRAYGYANQFGFADAYSLGVASGAKMVWKQESGSTAKIFKGGALVGTSTTGTYTDPFNRLRMDGALLDKPVKIKQFVFFDNALTDAECIQLTA